jgi:hypothetical protein
LTAEGFSQIFFKQTMHIEGSLFGIINFANAERFRHLLLLVIARSFGGLLLLYPQSTILLPEVQALENGISWHRHRRCQEVQAHYAGRHQFLQILPNRFRYPIDFASLLVQ